MVAARGNPVDGQTQHMLWAGRRTHFAALAVSLIDDNPSFWGHRFLLIGLKLSDITGKISSNNRFKIHYQPDSVDLEVSTVTGPVIQSSLTKVVSLSPESCYNTPMKVFFYATFRQIVGAKSIELDLPEGSSIQAVLSAVIERYPRLEDAMLDETSQLRPYVHVFINGRDAQYLPDGHATRLGAGDKIDFFPPVAGG
jgi:MoaD family protein